MPEQRNASLKLLNYPLHSLLFLITMGLHMNTHATPDCAPALDFTVRPLAGGTPQHLCETYKGQVVLIVNTASKCGYTPQYEGLEALYAKHKDEGFTILGFPSNDFMNQEPGTEQEIKEFCRLTYGVRFPMFEKMHVHGSEASPLYQSLRKLAGAEPQWNFHKYLLDRKGQVLATFASAVKPDDKELTDAIKAALAAPKP
jgi:glutathione peroxidase